MKNIEIVMNSILGDLSNSDRYVLDIGTGSANMALSLSEIKIKCVTIDKSDRVADIAKNIINDYSGDLPPFLIKMDACNMDFLDETFDAVVTYKALHHIKNSVRAIEEMYRVCKPGGRIVIVEHSIENRRAIDFLNKIKTQEHPQEIDIEEIQKELRKLAGQYDSYHTPIGEVFVVTKPKSDLIKVSTTTFDLKDSYLGEYGKNQFIFDIEKKMIIKKNMDNGESKALFVPITKEADVAHSLCLDIANTCNMGCRYCYASGGNYQNEERIMKKELAMKSLDWYAEYLNDKFHVIFFGGEPLVNKKLVLEVLKDNKYETTYSMNTNGTLLDENVVYQMVEHNGKISLSIDGKEEIHNKLRVYKNGKPSYKDAIRVFESVDPKYKGRIWARMTISNEVDDIYENVLHIVSLGFKFIDLSFVNGNYELSEKKEQIKDWEASLDKLVKYSLKAWINDEVHIYPFAKVFQEALYGLRALSTCTAGRELFSVQPEGDIVPCFKFSNVKLGDIENGVDPEKVLEFNTLKNIQRNLLCKECWAYDFCGGLCPKDMNVILKIKSIRCHMTKYIITRCLYHLCVENEEQPKAIQRLAYKNQMLEMLKSMKSKEKNHDS